MSLEQILKELEVGGNIVRDPDNYFFCRVRRAV